MAETETPTESGSGIESPNETGSDSLFRVDEQYTYKGFNVEVALALEHREDGVYRIVRVTAAGQHFENEERVDVDGLFRKVIVFIKRILSGRRPTSLPLSKQKSSVKRDAERALDERASQNSGTGNRA